MDFRNFIFLLKFFISTKCCYFGLLIGFEGLLTWLYANINLGLKFEKMEFHFSFEIFY